MKLYDVDLTLQKSKIKVTVFNVEAGHLNEAITEAKQYLKNPLEWFCTGLDASKDQAQDGEPAGDSE